MKHALIFILLMSVALHGFPAKRAMHPASQIDYVCQQIRAQAAPCYPAYRQLLHMADSIQHVPQHALVDFAVPGFYDKPEEHRANSLAIQQDAFGAYCSALAWRLSGKKKYGEKAAYFLNAWASTNRSYSEHDGVLVMTYSGSGFLMAAELMSGTKAWPSTDEARFKTWTESVYRKAANEIRTHKNNWADWGRFGSLLAAAFLDDRAEVDENVRLIRSDLFLKIAPDGSMPEETVRGGNGIWYTYFSLAPLTAACWLVYNLTGENLFALSDANGACIKKAVDYLSYYNLHPDEWRWHEKPNTGMKEVWPGNLLEAMSGVYGDAGYVEYAEKRRPIVYERHHFAWVFPTLMPVGME
jgi:hypothetical protein